MTTITITLHLGTNKQLIMSTVHFPNGVSILSLQYTMFRFGSGERESSHILKYFQVQKVIENLTTKTIEETVKELIMENSFLKNEQLH